MAPSERGAGGRTEGECRECAEEHLATLHKPGEDGGKVGTRGNGFQQPSDSVQTKIKTKGSPQELRSSEEANTFLEQLISDRLHDLVTVQPDGGIKLNMCEQFSAIL